MLTTGQVSVRVMPGDLLDGPDDELAQVVDAVGLAAHDDVVGTRDLEGLEHPGDGAGGEHDLFARANFRLNQDVRLYRHEEPFSSRLPILPVFLEGR